MRDRDACAQSRPILLQPHVLGCYAPRNPFVDSPMKKTGVGCHLLVQGTFLTQGSNPGLSNLLHRQADTLN